MKLNPSACSPPFALMILAAIVAAVAQSAELPPTGANVVAPTYEVEALVAEVVQKNPELDFYRAEIAAAKAGRRTAAQWNNPELTADLGSKRVWERGGPALGDGVAWSVSVAQSFEFPGRIALRKAIANRQVELAELGLGRFQVELAASARAKARTAFAAQQKAEAVEEVTQRFRALLEVLVQREPAGITPLLDQRIIEANAITMQRRITEARREQQLALVELNRLRGVPAATPLRLTGRMDLATNVPPIPLLLELAGANSFDLRIRQAELAQQGFRVELAKNERYPKVTLAPFYAAETANDEQRIVGLSVSVPLPLWERNQGNIEAAKARVAQAEASLRTIQRDLDRQVTEHALGLENQLKEMALWRKDAQGQFREAAELADRHYRLGAVPVTVYVEMQMKYLEALEVLLAAQQEAFEHQQQLELLVGKPLKEVKLQ